LLSLTHAVVQEEELAERELTLEEAYPSASYLHSALCWYVITFLYLPAFGWSRERKRATSAHLLCFISLFLSSSIM
jgi:hypothetical protein